MANALARQFASNDYSNQLLVTVPCGENRLLIGFLNSYVGKFQLKFVTVQVVRPQAAQVETQTRLAGLLTQTEASTISVIIGSASQMERACKF